MALHVILFDKSISMSFMPFWYLNFLPGKFTFYLEIEEDLQKLSAVLILKVVDPKFAKIYNAEPYSEPGQTSKMKLFEKIGSS